MSKPLVTVALAALLVATTAAAAPAVERIEQGGIAVTFEHDTGPEGNSLARLVLSDARTGRPVRGARPAAWLLARRSEQVAAESSCEDKAALLTGGSLGQRADVDLNGYRLLTLNHDRTIAFINPQVRLKNTQLESIVPLPADGHDWLLAPAVQRLAVTLREGDAVALVDTVSRRLAATVPTGAGSRPTRLALDPDGQRLWVGLDGSAEVLAIDLTHGKVLGRVATGRGLHTLSAPADSPWLFVTHSTAGTVTLIDRATLRRVAEVPVGVTPVASAWSESAQRLTVLSANGGGLSLLDGAAQRVTATVPLPRGTVALGLFDDGRRALVLNMRTHTLTLVDLASARVVAERALPAQPDQLAFTRDFAYVRSLSTPDLQLISLAAAREGRLEGPSVPMGRRAPDQASDAVNVAGAMAPAPEGNGMLVANPGDGSIYRYVQGMMVPVDSHSNYRRRARGLLVLDASLGERAPGRFEASLRVPRSGRYDVVVRNLRPALTACFTVTLDSAAPDATARAAAVRVRPRLLETRTSDDGSLVLEFELADGASSDAVGGPVTVLLMQRQGTWQARAQAHAVGAGRYRAQLHAPHGLPAGELEALVDAPARQLAYADGRLGRIAWPQAPTRP